MCARCYKPTGDTVTGLPRWARASRKKQQCRKLFYWKTITYKGRRPNSIGVWRNDTMGQEMGLAGEMEREEERVEGRRHSWKGRLIAVREGSFKQCPKG